MRISPRIYMAALTLMFPAAAMAASQAATPFYARALANPNRPPLEIALDANRKPLDVLTFAGIKPGMHIAELKPDGGYYTRILSGVVGAKGKIYAVVPRGMGEEKVKEASVNEALTPIERAEIVEDQPGFKNVDVYWEQLDTRGGTFALPEQIDMLFSAYDYHEMKGEAFAKLDTAGLAKAIYRGMKNGGVVVVLDTSIDPAIVKSDMTGAGFVLDAEKTSLGDGFGLRFKKPMNAPNTDQRPKDYKKTIGALFGNTLISNPGTVEVGDGPREHRHFLHEDGTYQEIGKADSRNNVFASGMWFFNADGWNCRRHLYQPSARDMTDCAAVPHSYEHKVGDKWSEPRGDYTLLKGYVYFDN